MTTVMSYGGGVQTVAMVVLQLQGRIAPFDHIVFADTSREVSSTWEYMRKIVNPALPQPVSIASHKLATVDLYAGNGDMLLPMYTDSGGKLPTFCSNEWKQRVVMRWLRANGVNDCDTAIGYTIDEAGRAKPSGLKWYRRTFPLIELGLTRADCEVIIKDYGWPPVNKSACYMCPNMNDREWAHIKSEYPEDFQKAIDLENEVREWDENLFLHGDAIPLADVQFDPNRTRLKTGALQCSFGCFT